MTNDYPDYKNVSKTNDQTIDLSSDFVATAIRYNKNSKPCHAGIAICFEGEINIFHYTGTEILLEKVDDQKWYIQNKLSIFEDEETVSFLRHCHKILKNFNEKEHVLPNYGFYYNGSYYKDGKYYSDGEDYQYMTCVGFCLAVITGAIEADQFFKYDEWKTPDHVKSGLFEDYMESYLEGESEEVVKRIKNQVRRIPPIDYFTSSFCSSIPVTYSEVNEIYQDVEDYILKNLID